MTLAYTSGLKDILTRFIEEVWNAGNVERAAGGVQEILCSMVFVRVSGFLWRSRHILFNGGKAAL